MNYLPELQPVNEAKVYAAFRLQKLNILVQPDHPPAQSARFGLTNFIFTGTERLPSGAGDLSLPLTLSGRDREHRVFVRPMHEYSKIRKRVQTNKAIDVTCELICSVMEFDGLEQVAEVADDLCTLFSVARSTKIQWIYVDQYDQADQLIMRTHSSRVTKPYSPLAIIDYRSSSSAETRRFIEHGYKIYLLKREAYKLNQGTIDAYLDAKAEQDFLETRGAKLAVAMEMLKTVFLERPGSPLKRFIIEKELFDKLTRQLIDNMKSVLTSAGVTSPDDINAVCNSRKIKGLNRRSFRHFIEKLCKEVGFPVKANEVELFVKSRDSLVHSGRFYSILATDEEQQGYPQLRSVQSEYFYLVNFLDRIFLRLLGYTGTYIDWSSPGKPTRAELASCANQSD